MKQGPLLEADLVPKVQAVRWANGALALIDQRRLPARFVTRRCRRVEEVAEAIETLQVRGAPAIGIAAAYGVVLGVCPSTGSGRTEQRSAVRPGTRRAVRPGTHRAVRPELRRRTNERAAFLRRLDTTIARLGRTRPTAVNLHWALARMRDAVDRHPRDTVARWRQRLLAEARAIHAEDRRRCAAIGAAGAAVLKPGDTVMTHCNTGGLATGGLGTAFAVLVTAHAQGKGIHVLACEARPVWQGARLTMWELQRYGVPATLICDTAAASTMIQRNVAAVIVGADRIAANGDTANKIGTYGLAVLARAHGIPFYVAAPTSTVDPATPTGGQIPIEERPAAEVTTPYGLPVAPRGARAMNPAFDVTPHALISGIITEHGVLRPPYSAKLRHLGSRS